MAKNPNKKSVINCLFSKWEEVEEIGEGGNGWVFKVTKNAELRAVKVLRRFERYERFSEEVRSANKLRGIPGVVEVLEANLPTASISDQSIDSLPYFEMQFIDGGSLETVIEKGIDNSRGINSVIISLGIAHVIAGIHRKSFAHRDLKPDNILLDKSGKIFISDYGLCIDLTNNPDSRLTNTQEIVGGFYYRAPEFLRGRIDSSNHCPGDIFSFGRIIWSLLLGRKPEGITDHEFSLILPSAFIRDLRKPVIIEGLISDCTNINPAKRPTINEAIDILNSWLQEPRSGSLEELTDKVTKSANASIVIERQKIAENMQSTFEQFSTAARTFFENHPFILALRRNLKYPDQISIDGLSNWSPDLSSHAELFGIITGCSLRFNVGSLALAPLVGVQCGIKNSESGYIVEVVAGAIHSTDTKTIEWGPSSFSFKSFNSIAQARLNDDLNKAIDFIRKELGVHDE